MKLKITQEFFLEVESDWYKFLSEYPGSLEEKIVAYEKKEAEEGLTNWDKLEKGKTTVEAIKEE